MSICLSETPSAPTLQVFKLIHLLTHGNADEWGILPSLEEIDICLPRRVEPFSFRLRSIVPIGRAGDRS